MKNLLTFTLGLLASFSMTQAATLAEVLQASIDQSSPVSLSCENAYSGKRYTFNISAELSPATQLGNPISYSEVLTNPFLGAFAISGDAVRQEKFSGSKFKVVNRKLSKLTFGDSREDLVHISSNPLQIRREFRTQSRTNSAGTITGYTYVGCITSID
jgi:hypothetical protein